MTFSPGSTYASSRHGAQVIWTDTTTDSNLGSVTVVPSMAPGVSAATLTTAKLNAQVTLRPTLTLTLTPTLQCQPHDRKAERSDACL